MILSDLTIDNLNKYKAKLAHRETELNAKVTTTILSDFHLDEIASFPRSESRVESEPLLSPYLNIAYILIKTFRTKTLHIDKQRSKYITSFMNLVLSIKYLFLNGLLSFKCRL